jgi:hypothetical protein
MRKCYYSGGKRKSSHTSHSIRFVIAEYSLRHLTGVGLLIVASEKGAGMPATAEAAHSLQSGLSGKNRETVPHFADSAASLGGNSLQSRLSGGERRIRTVSTTPVVIYRKVKLDSQTLRLVIANHSPRVFAKTDLCSATREKARGNVFS